MVVGGILGTLIGIGFLWSVVGHKNKKSEEQAEYDDTYEEEECENTTDGDETEEEGEDDMEDDIENDMVDTHTKVLSLYRLHQVKYLDTETKEQFINEGYNDEDFVQVSTGIKDKKVPNTEFAKSIYNGEIMALAKEEVKKLGLTGNPDIKYEKSDWVETESEEWDTAYDCSVSLIAIYGTPAYCNISDMFFRVEVRNILENN